MNNPSQNEITERLVAWSNGDENALDHLMPAVYHELRRMADRYLRREDPGHTLQRKRRVVELRYLAGLSVDETALALRVSPQTVLRDWNLAKAWLYHELKKK